LRYLPVVGVGVATTLLETGTRIRLGGMADTITLLNSLTRTVSLADPQARVPARAHSAVRIPRIRLSNHNGLP